IYSTAVSYGLPAQIATFLSNLPPSGLLFAAFLGINPASALPTSIAGDLPSKVITILDSHTFLPSVLGPTFIIGLRFSIYIAVVLVLIGAIFSYMRGKKYVIDEQ
ncbi:MAG: hypothetical protein QXV49_06025, partial [Conexivisphaerales archaeon]